VLAHSDTTGTEQVNQSLSEKRASAVASFLARHGVGRARIASTGFGDTAPLYPADVTEQQRAANRRVEIRLVPFRSTDAPASGARRKRS
jgi:outer membrane protein OmpA-like peptidoglycan-associated protein